MYYKKRVRKGKGEGVDTGQIKGRIRKQIRVFVLAALLLCTLCACQDRAGEKETSHTDLPELKIGISRIKPFFYRDQSGDDAGVDADLAREACRRAGYTPVFVDLAFDEKKQALQDGEVDCLWGEFLETQQGESCRWTDCYLETSIAILVQQSCPDESLETLRSNGGIAAIAGSKTEQILLETIQKKDIQQNVYSCDSFSLAETAFVKGYAGAFACNEMVLQEIMREYPDTYRILDEKLASASLGVVFLKESDPACFDRINSALAGMKADGTVSQLCDSYHIKEADTQEVHADGQD